MMEEGGWCWIEMTRINEKHGHESGFLKGEGSHGTKEVVKDVGYVAGSV